jgi:predicted transcriptional regulator
VHKLQHRLNEVTIAEPMTRYEAGMTGLQLAAEFDTSKASVMKLLRQRGIVIRQSRFTDAEQADIVRLFREGVTQFKIATRLERDRSSIWHVLHRAGLVGRS